jgi:DNA-binding LacI/PurR family transcriptional regulator
MESNAGSKKQPKYLDIVESLKSDISSGRFRAGSRLPSEAELVRKFRVSRMTVVKAVQQLGQQGLLVRRPGSGTYVASAVRDSGLVFGLLIPDLGQTEIFEPICRGMVSSPLAATHSLSWGHSVPSAENRSKEAEQLCHTYIEQQVAGVFFAPQEFHSPREDVNGRILNALSKADIPVVLLDRCVLRYPERGAYDLIGLDNRRAGYIITDHLVRQGGRHVAFFAREGSAETVEDRIAGYREALIHHGLPIDKGLILRGDATDKSFVENVLRVRAIDSVMCANDRTAASLMHTLIGLGVEIPHQIRIAGVDNVRYASLLPIPLTSFEQPCTEIGVVAMSAMLERARNRELPARSIMLNGVLVPRLSTAAVA